MVLQCGYVEVTTVLPRIRDYNIRYRFWYEPYLLMSPRYMPFFDSRFVYYGFDKVCSRFAPSIRMPSGRQTPFRAAGAGLCTVLL